MRSRSQYETDDPSNIEHLGHDPTTPLLTTEGAEYDIPVEGSLGLLAMGYVGIMLWREKRNSSGQPDE